MAPRVRLTVPMARTVKVFMPEAGFHWQDAALAGVQDLPPDPLTCPLPFSAVMVAPALMVMLNSVPTDAVIVRLLAPVTSSVVTA
jgi:hypothetical protein